MQRNPAYSQIMAQSLMKCRLQVANEFRRKTVNINTVNKIAGEIETSMKKAGSPHLELFREQKEKALAAMSASVNIYNPHAPGQLPDDDIRLDTPELQLLWGTALASLVLEWQKIGANNPHSPPFDYRTAELWKLIVAQDELEEQRRLCAQAASSIPGLRERQGTMGIEWDRPKKGYPELGFMYHPETGRIQLDLVWTMIIGMEHAQSIILRQVGYSIGSLFFTDKMQEVRAEMLKIKRKESRTPEEHDQMVRLAAQWLARYDLTIAAESNYANSFVAELAEVSAQNYAASLNHAEVVVGGIQKLPKGLPADPPNAKIAFANLCRALHYTFFQENSLFPNSEDGWRSVGVEPQWIATSDGLKKGADALEELQEMSRKMAALKPDLRDRLSGGGYYAKRMEECSVARNKMADEIFDRFAGHILPELEQEAEENPDETMDRMDDMSGDSQKDQQKKDGKKKDKKEKGDSDDGDEGDEGEPDGDEAEVDGEGRKRDSKLPPKKPGEARGEEPGEGEGEPGEGEPGEGEGEPGEGEGEPGEGEGEGEGEPGEGEPGEGEGEDGDSDEDGELTDDEAKKLIKKEESEDGGGGDGPGDTMTDEEPEPDREGNYNAYQQIIAPHSQAITQATEIMKKIQDKLSIPVQDPSIKNSLVPEDNDITRFQPGALQDRLIKQLSGQPIDESDFETFRLDGPIRYIPATTEIQIWIDGSGSMQGQPIEMAITTGCILYEAAREAGMDVYITMLGDPNPLPIAKPGMTKQQIGKAIESVRLGQGGDKDYLSPTVDAMIENTIAQKRKAFEMVGNTHIFVVTDAGFSDGQAAFDTIRNVAQNCPHATMDFALIGNYMSPQVTTIADEFNKKSRRQPIGAQPVPTPNDIHDKVIAMLTERMKSIKTGDAIPLRQKQKEFENTKQKNKTRHRFGR